MPVSCSIPEALIGKTENESDNCYNQSSNLTKANKTSMKDFIEYDIGIFLVKFIWPLIIFAGTIGNILSFSVLIRRRMRRTSVYFYLAMLACADSCTLYLSGFKTWLRVLTGYELLHLSNGSCKILMFLFLQSLHLSAIFIVAVTVDRFLIIWFTFKNRSNHSTRKSGRITLCAFLCLLLYNCHVFWTIGLQRTKGTRLICAPFKENAFMGKIFPWLKLSLYTVVPFLVVFILNIAIAIKMFNVFYQTQDHEQGKDRKGTSIKLGQYRITMMLLAVSFTWLILTAPFTLFTFVSDETNTSRQKAKQFLLKTICFTLLYINHSINFYLYCVTGRRFRKEFAEFIRSLRHRGKMCSGRGSKNLMRVDSKRELKATTYCLNNFDPR